MERSDTHQGFARARLFNGYRKLNPSYALRRTSERFSTLDLLHKYGADYKVVFVGDAAMAPYEITQAGGSVEHWNEEPGYQWIKRFMGKYKKLIWINPYPKDTWNYTASTNIMRELIDDQMYPLTLTGWKKA